ncbi:hypothetical protein, variant [Puccinia triticina 1-1 BBBD Race 1]|uniref:ATPase of the ABC class n=2 Tax=Puccinia triticina TaxID=208348 RepID=A0A180H1E4_PUCT1|nr:uncharacterized protein PtA15_11A655 [Puccinia triticina]OAV98603.1 hypothetical protein PTTG_01769 [Puccinia triticina 1-1 BBBD Race 1]OAV98604.1 hypothetical protein, variant [Puccinia triticina 1-1 BBBD Race 1]WAQ89963.1 hypothetical protein PtA15_11A655 [Puccinia triticina]
MSGRGAYYKARYGGGGRAGGATGNQPSFTPQSHDLKRLKLDAGAQNGAALRQMLLERDNRPYPAYRDTEGFWKFDRFRLGVMRIQSDPFAPPTRLKINLSDDQHRWPEHLRASPIRRVALADWLTRRFARLIRLPQNGSSSPSGSGGGGGGGGWHGPKGGDFSIDVPGEQVLDRSSCRFNDQNGELTLRMSINLPARGRSILGELAAKMLCDQLANYVDRGLVWVKEIESEAAEWVETVEDQHVLRNLVTEAGLTAFIGNGSILPRQSGASALPMPSSTPGLVPFKSPPTLERVFELPNRGKVAGMAIPKGITIIVGGGFHGKSTLLEAISNGPSNHTPTSGLNLVVTPSATIPVASEDGRMVNSCHISPFIRNLPNGKDTDCFSTSDASGSTSMAASCVEAIELLGGQPGTILLDEDGCAVNFLIRDDKMRLLVQRESEPITPYIFKVQSLCKDHDISTIMVVGGCGDYCHVADCCIMMENYQAFDATDRAKKVADSFTFEFEKELETGFEGLRNRQVSTKSLLPRSSPPKITVKSTHSIQHGPEASEPDHQLDLSGLIQLSTSSQTRSIAGFLAHFGAGQQAQSLTLQELMALYERLWQSEEGLERLAEAGRIDPGALAKVNKLLVGMAVNRLRTAKFEQLSSNKR